MNYVNCGVVLLNDQAVVPAYSRDGDACFDISASAVIFNGDDTVTCHTGLAFNIPEGWYMEVFSRSGHGFKHNTRLANCVAIIDQNYKGELIVKLSADRGLDFIPEPEHRIAQGILKQRTKVKFIIENESTKSERGSDGFGSSGQ